MKGSKEDVVLSWLTKAKNDIISARKLSKGKTIVLDTAIYHCQQAAEKAIKAYLVYHEIEYQKTHDLRILVNLASKNDHDFAELIEYAEILTPYAIEYRYPDDIMEPSKEEFLEAFAIANKIISFVVTKLSFLNPLFNSKSWSK